MISRDIDSIDVRLLKILQDDARLSVAEMARRLELAPSAVHARLRRLEEDRVLRGYEPRIDPVALGFGLTAFIFVVSDERPGHLDTGEALARLPEVQELHHITGEDCFLMKVRVRDMEDLARLMREGIGSVATVRNTRTTVVFDTIKETTALPLPAEAQQPESVSSAAAAAPEGEA